MPVFNSKVDQQFTNNELTTNNYQEDTKVTEAVKEVKTFATEIGLGTEQSIFTSMKLRMPFFFSNTKKKIALINQLHRENNLDKIQEISDEIAKIVRNEGHLLKTMIAVEKGNSNDALRALPDCYTDHKTTRKLEDHIKNSSSISKNTKKIFEQCLSFYAMVGKERNMDSIKAELSQINTEDSLWALVFVLRNDKAHIDERKDTLIDERIDTLKKLGERGSAEGAFYAAYHLITKKNNTTLANKQFNKARENGMSKEEFEAQRNKYNKSPEQSHKTFSKELQTWLNSQQF